MGDPLERARGHLRRLARAPRPAGSDADTAARNYAAGVLRDAGYVTGEHHFGYSQLPGRFATPVFGAVGIATVAAAALLGSAQAPGTALALVVVVGFALALAGRWLARDGVLDFPAMRARGVNLYATRGPAPPSVWLVAHTDSKSQPVPQAMRAGGIVLLALSLAGSAALAVAQVFGWVEASSTAWWWLAAAGAIGGAPVVASVVGSRSEGALDNASGVAAVLLAAESIPGHLSTGVLITAAEELGLAGARAWAAGEASGQIALNCDGVDDVGMLTAMYSGRAPRAVLSALSDAAAEGGFAFRAIRLVPGLLVDAVALADAGWETATLSRGTLATLARVHTAHDSLDHLDGTGIPETAAVLAAAAGRLATKGAR